MGEYSGMRYSEIRGNTKESELRCNPIPSKSGTTTKVYCLKTVLYMKSIIKRDHSQ